MTGVFSFEHVWLFWAALAMGGVAGIVAYMRRIAAPNLTMMAGAIALIFLALAAGRLILQRVARQSVMVMVDLSPSTRTADYRDRVTLDRRIHELLGETPYRVAYFASAVQESPSSGNRLADLPAERTVYTPPAGAAAVLLFSDCRFELPHALQPTYVALDPGLEDPEDASIVSLEMHGQDLAVTVNNSGGTRQLTTSDAAAKQPTTVPAGSFVINHPLAHAASIAAQLSAGDAWPENDSLAMQIPPPRNFQRWWVGATGAPSGWRAFAAAELPTDPADYLAAGLIVLQNISASDLNDLQLQRLNQYVRDLGGGLIILGGDRAFAAGGYEGTALDTLSPLASHPPQPANHWIVLADSSGSMSSPAVGSGATRWKLVCDAVSQVLPHLPPGDVVSVGSFSNELHWWLETAPARTAAATSLPPADAYPHGPTNLQPALANIAQSVDGKMPVQLLVLSDFDTQITDAGQLGVLLASKNIHLHLLALEEGPALKLLDPICHATGGKMVTQLDPARWAASARQLASAAGSGLIEKGSITASFEGAASHLAPLHGEPWNRVWLKSSAELLAAADVKGESVPMVGRWNVGEGRVLATGIDVPPGTLEQLTPLAARQPHDPRFHVTWSVGSKLKVTVDALGGNQYINRQSLSLQLAGDDAAAHSIQPIVQTAPGRYEIELPAPRQPVIATVSNGPSTIAQTAVAGRYAPEFEHLGNDRSAMEELARRSGGAVVLPTQSSPLDIRWPRRPVDLSSLFAIVGGLFLALGLAWWRLR